MEPSKKRWESPSERAHSTTLPFRLVGAPPPAFGPVVCPASSPSTYSLGKGGRTGFADREDVGKVKTSRVGCWGAAAGGGGAQYRSVRYSLQARSHIVTVK